MSRIIALLSLMLLTSPASAADPALAKQYVDGVGAQALSIINSKSPTAGDELKTMLEQNVDVEWMAPEAIGDAWDNATAEQQTAYLTAYRAYLLKRYSTQFSEYAGSQYVIQNAVQDAANDETLEAEYTVRTVVTTGKKNIRADYRIKEVQGVFKIIDMMVDGISLLNTQRTEFASVMKQKGMNGLIADLNTRAAN